MPFSQLGTLKLLGRGGCQYNIYYHELIIFQLNITSLKAHLLISSRSYHLYDLKKTPEIHITTCSELDFLAHPHTLENEWTDNQAHLPYPPPTQMLCSRLLKLNNWLFPENFGQPVGYFNKTQRVSFSDNNVPMCQNG